MIKKLGYFLIYVGVPFGIPALLMQFSGSLLFLFYPVWLFISYKFIQKSCEDREPINWMEHTDAMGWVFAFGMPAIVSAIGYFTYYIVNLDYLLSDELSTGSTVLDLILLAASIYYIYKFIVRPILKEAEKKAREKKLRKLDIVDRDHSKKFEPPKFWTQYADINKYKEPRITQNRLDKFIEWSKEKKLSNLIVSDSYKCFHSSYGDDNPSLKLLGYYESYGTIKNDNFEFPSKRIITQEFVEEVSIYNDDVPEEKNWAMLIDKPELYPVEIYQGLDGIYNEETEYDNEKPNLTTNYYLSIDETEYISKYGDTANEFTSNYENRFIGYKLLSIDYPQQFSINGKWFEFKENEKDHLVILLIATYKSSLLKRILTELDK